MKLNSILFKNDIIYFNEIIEPIYFKRLYLIEKPIYSFETKIIKETDRPFANLPIKLRKNIIPGKVCIIRLIKLNKKFEFLTKIYMDGKFNIPKIVSETINFDNYELLKFEIININNQVRLTKRKIDLVNLIKYNKNIKIIQRANNFITIYSKQKIPITLPRFIAITPNLLNLFYLIHGDGHYGNKLYFVNKNLNLHKSVINEFNNILKIPKNLWKVKLMISNLNKTEEAKKYWQENLNLKDYQFYPGIAKPGFNSCELGNLRICLDNSIVATVFRYIFNNLYPLNEKNSLDALNGLLDAEGGVQIDKKGIHKITLSFNKKEQDLFENILKGANLIKLFRIEQNRNFIISKWENQYLFINSFIINNKFPFPNHDLRKSKLIKGFLNHSYTKTLEKYLIIISEKMKSTKELSSNLNIRNDSFLNTIRKERYRKFINLSGKGINKNSYKFTISNEGKNFMKMIQKIKEMEVKNESITI